MTKRKRNKPEPFPYTIKPESQPFPTSVKSYCDRFINKKESENKKISLPY